MIYQVQTLEDSDADTQREVPYQIHVIRKKKLKPGGLTNAQKQNSRKLANSEIETQRGSSMKKLKDTTPDHSTETVTEKRI